MGRYKKEYGYAICQRLPPPIKKAENASIIPGMRINDRAARYLYVGSLLKRERVVKMHVTS